jgi:hypothetical protein
MIQPTLTLPTQEAAAQMLVTGEPRTGLFKLGMFDFFPSLAASVYYDDNINNHNTDRQEDVVWTLSPGLSAVAVDGPPGEDAKSLRLDYTPGFLWYTHHSSQDTVTQAGSAAGTWPFARLVLGFSEAINSSTAPVVDVGARTEQLSSTTGLTSRYRLGEKTSMEINAGLSILEYADPSYVSSWDWSNHDWLNYELDPKLSLGVGLALGYIDLKGYPDQNYEQGLARAVYAVAEKLTLNASIGANWQQFRSSVSDTLNPVWDLAATYRPADATTITVNVYQRYNTSAAIDDNGGTQNYLSTGGGVSFSQRLRQRWSLNAAGTYYHARYESTQAGSTASRDDDVFQVRASVDFQIRERWSASLFYAFESDQSNQANFTFNRNQVGLLTTWSF